MAVRTSRMVSGGRPSAIAERESQSAVARMPPRLSEGWPHSAASQVSLKSSQRIMAPMLKAACTGSSSKAGAGNARAVGNDGAGDDGAEELGAGRVFERFEAAAERVDEAVLRGGVSEIAA